MSEALYRKYRPQVFSDVVGQNHIERTIKNAIEQDKVSHAYLFCGPRGTGKTTTARLLAKALLCEKAPTAEPDGTCEDCRMIAAGEHPDVYELDAASRTGVDNVREEIIGRVQFAPTRGAKKIYIIDEVHMLSTAAFNALLKTLEEPPAHVVFILCTTDPQKVPETIHSRCQRFDFRRIAAEEMVSRLGAICMAEGVEFEGDALDLIAHRAEGGMRNALTSLEQAIAYGAGHVTLEVVESLVGALDASDMAEIVGAIGRRDVAACFTWVANYVETGADLAQFACDLAEHVRNMYVISLAGPDAPLGVSDAERREIADELALYGPDRLARMLGVLGDVIAEFKTTTNARLTFEIALTRMVRPESDITLAALAERIESLEARIAQMASGQGAAAQPVAAAVCAPVATESASAAVTPAPAQAVDHATAPRETASEAQAHPQPVRTEAPVPAEAAHAPATAQADAPSQAAAPTADGVVADLSNPAALQRAWQSVVAAVKRDKAAYAVLLLNTRAVYDAAHRSVAIEFPAESAFAFKAVQKPEVNDAVAQAFAQVMHGNVAFSFVKAAEGSPSASAQTVASAAQQPQPEPEWQVRVQPQPEPQLRSESQVQQPWQQPNQVAAEFRPLPQAQAQERRTDPQPDPARSAVPAPDDMPPYGDEVPVDLYDGMAAEPYEPFDARADRAQAGATAEQSAPAARAGRSSSPSQPASAASPAAQPQSADPAAAGDRDDLARMLSETFGAGVRVEEV